ncbi:phosphatase [Thiosulfatimonas sediminis]|uniref:Phosphatase n=1 Tax=Thiosulfatimonas sediminis TaxID=2675054 RepID=A0A6F8PTL1_9GAMM|nr:inositol monophosphatase [Thiosulfatimonas sediminis]BBP45320.1 phosphatase [Thiosulfatimonas sediminis]
MINFVFNQPSQWQQLKNGIRQLAKSEILARFEQVGFEQKADGSLLTEADTEMQKQTQRFLARNWPEFAFLGEEMSLEQQKKALCSPQGCWILDPVDGTSNFASGIPVYAVSLALMMNGELVAGLVYDPDRDEMFAARLGQGAELNDQRLVAQTPKRLLKQTSGIIDFKRLTPELAFQIIQDNPYASQRSFGSVALDWAWLAAGRGHIYIHGSQNIWDYAAGLLILTEAGGKSCTLEGEAVLLPQIKKRSAVAATTPELFKQWADYLKI